MATLMLDGGADVRFIQAMFGHEQPISTQLYTHVAIRKLKEIHTATHAVAKLERRDRAADSEAAGDADAGGGGRAPVTADSCALRR